MSGVSSNHFGSKWSATQLTRRMLQVVVPLSLLREVEAICQRVIVMHRGRKALDAPLSEVTSGGSSLEDVFARVVASDPLDVPGGSDS